MSKRDNRLLSTLLMFDSLAKTDIDNLEDSSFVYTNPYSILADNNKKQPKGKRIEVRTEAKIGRNDICPKCESGLKYKKCCINKL